MSRLGMSLHIFLLRIVVREHDEIENDDFGGQTCLHVSNLRTGNRRRR